MNMIKKAKIQLALKGILGELVSWTYQPIIYNMLSEDVCGIVEEKTKGSDKFTEDDIKLAIGQVLSFNFKHR